MRNCIFCGIAQGTISAYVVYQDAATVAFLNIFPPMEGHTIVIPKVHTSQVWEMSQTDYDALFKTVLLVGKRIREIYQPVQVGVQIEGLEIAHTHVKVFPFNTEKEFHKPQPSAQPDPEVLTKVRKKLKIP